MNLGSLPMPEHNKLHEQIDIHEPDIWTIPRLEQDCLQRKLVYMDPTWGTVQRENWYPWTLPRLEHN